MKRREPDKSGKWLIEMYGGSILKLAGLQNVRKWKALQAEVVQPRKLPDGLLEVFFRGRKKPDHVLLEIASHPEKRILQQAVDDLVLAYQHLRQLPDLLMLFLAPKGQMRFSGLHEVQSRLHWSRLLVHWKIVELWTLDSDALFAAGDVGLIPWVPLTHFEEPPEEIFERCRQRIEEQAPFEQQEHLFSVTQVLASLRYNDPDILNLLGGSKGMIEFPAIKRIVDEKVQETKHQDIQNVLRARFEEVDDKLLSRLIRIRNEKRLDELVKYAATCPDLDAFQSRLKPAARKSS